MLLSQPLVRQPLLRLLGISVLPLLPSRFVRHYGVDYSDNNLIAGHECLGTGPPEISKVLERGDVKPRRRAATIRKAPIGQVQIRGNRSILQSGPAQKPIIQPHL
jgi:hypothetical protein